MDRNLALVLIFGLCVLGPSLVFAFGNATSINALARNPDSAPRIFIGLIARTVLVATVAVLAMLLMLEKFA